MGIQAEIKSAIDGGRDDLIRVLAERRVLPSVVEQSGSGLLGKSTPTFSLDPTEEGSGTIDRQTTVQVVNALGLESEDDCESVREEIRDHSSW
jgi:hypothetical protein